MKKIGYALMIIGSFLTCYGSLLIYQRYSSTTLSFMSYEATKIRHGVKAEQPIKIVIKRIHLNAPIKSVQMYNNKWPTLTNSVAYLLHSPLPGSKGNSILYGHNWASLLARLNEVQPGDEIALYFSNNHMKKFTVQAKAIVNPDQADILSPTQDHRITLYTCTGFLDSKRLVVTALLNQSISSL